MTTRSSKFSNGGTLVEEPIFDQPAPEAQPETTPSADRRASGRASAKQPGTRQSDAILSGGVAIAPDMPPVKKIIQPDEETDEDRSEGGRASTTQQFVTFIAGDEVFAADIGNPLSARGRDEHDITSSHLLGRLITHLYQGLAVEDHVPLRSSP